MEHVNWWHKWSHPPIRISTCETAGERFNGSLTNTLSTYRTNCLHRAKPPSPLSSTLKTRLSAKRNKQKYLTPPENKALLSACIDIIYRFVGQATKHKSCNYTPPPINNSFLNHTERSTLRSQELNTVQPSERGLSLPLARRAEPLQRSARTALWNNLDCFIQWLWGKNSCCPICLSLNCSMPSLVVHKAVH